jgi:anti-sigma regulatory factor (Ser/Thr protein kinase)
MIEREDFPESLKSIAAARRYVAERLSDLEESEIEALTLMVSELATNSVRHAHSGFRLQIETEGLMVRIEITDLGSGSPQMSSPKVTDPSGRGLRIVDLLADSWGVEATASGAGKSVWFKMAVRNLQSNGLNV